jgi:L-asparagine oxygenase
MSSNSSDPYVLELSEEAREALRVAADEIMKYDLITEGEQFVTEAQVQAALLPEHVRRELIRFRRFGNEVGGLVISGVPIGDVPVTPVRADLSLGARLEAAAMMTVLLAVLGDQIGYKPENGGNLVQDVLPVPGNEDEQMSTGSTVDLKTHVEMAFSEHRSDYVALLCVRQDHDAVAGTTLSSIDRMLPLLDPETVRILGEPRFRTKVDKSFLVGERREEDIWTENVRIFNGAAARPQLRIDFAETEGTDDATTAALARLNEAAVAAQEVFRLKAGDLIICDNNRALHGRTSFAPRYDGADRWLLRVFVTKDLRRSEAVRPGDSRIVQPDYAESAPKIAVTDQRPNGATGRRWARGY